ncbi:MAG: hypothetical protein SGJ11_06095 [Phycisphaerae bacterium]|nr:hypothetical protein [Phycisphaerae bacterium]
MRTSTAHATAILSLVAVLTLSPLGCTGKAAPTPVLMAAAGQVHQGLLGWRSTQDEVVQLASEGVVDVDVEVFAGSVSIVSAPSAKQTSVSVCRIGSHGWGRSAESMESLGDIRYTVSLERRDGRDTAVLRAGSDTNEPHFQHVNVEIEVPDLGTVRVRTARGNIWISGNRSGADVATTRGSIRLMTGWKMDQPMTLVTSDGLIDLRIRGESVGAFDAETVGGAVRSRIKFGHWLAVDPRNDIDTLRATLNGGTNPIVLRTSNDDVMISIIPDPISQNPFPAIH